MTFDYEVQKTQEFGWCALVFNVTTNRAVERTNSQPTEEEAERWALNTITALEEDSVAGR